MTKITKIPFADKPSNRLKFGTKAPANMSPAERAELQKNLRVYEKYIFAPARFSSLSPSELAELANRLSITTADAKAIFHDLNTSLSNLGVEMSSPVAEIEEPAEPTKPSLQPICDFADLFGLQVRKKIKAVAGDYDEEIARLHKQRRYKTAQWNRILAWGYAILYVLRGPLDWVTDYLISAVKGR